MPRTAAQTQTRPASLRIHRDSPGSYRATIGPRDFTITQEDGQWIVREGGAVRKRDESFRAVRDYLCELAGHPGMTGMEYDRLQRQRQRRGRAWTSRSGTGRRARAVTQPEPDAPGVDEVELPEEVSDALIRGLGRRKVSGIRLDRLSGKVFGTIQRGGEAVRVTAEHPENPAESRWLMD